MLSCSPMRTSTERAAGAAAPAGGATPAAANDLFLRECRGEPTERRPVWMMRQAGRYLPEYRAVRDRVDFLTLCRTPELAVEATLMPLERYPVDGAVLFADIMLPLDGMGVDYEIRPGVGPVIANPIRTAADVDRIRVVDPEEGTPYVLEAVRQLRSGLDDRAAALGFAGAPFTLACYLVDGRPSREYPRTKALMYGEPELWGSFTSPTLVDTSPKGLDDPDAAFKAPASALMLRSAVLSDPSFSEMVDHGTPTNETGATLRFPK